MTSKAYSILDRLFALAMDWYPSFWTIFWECCLFVIPLIFSVYHYLLILSIHLCLEQSRFAPVDQHSPLYSNPLKLFLKKWLRFIVSFYWCSAIQAGNHPPRLLQAITARRLFYTCPSFSADFWETKRTFPYFVTFFDFSQ